MGPHKLPFIQIFIVAPSQKLTSLVSEGGALLSPLCLWLGGLVRPRRGLACFAARVSRTQSSTSLCSSSVKVPFLLLLLLACARGSPGWHGGGVESGGCFTIAGAAPPLCDDSGKQKALTSLPFPEIALHYYTAPEASKEL